MHSVLRSLLSSRLITVNCCKDSSLLSSCTRLSDSQFVICLETFALSCLVSPHLLAPSNHGTFAVFLLHKRQFSLFPRMHQLVPFALDAFQIFLQAVTLDSIPHHCLSKIATKLHILGRILQVFSHFCLFS